MSLNVDPRLVVLAVEEAPAVIQWLKDAFAKAHPGVPQPTSDEVIAAYNALFTASLAKDTQWLAAHASRPSSTPA